MSTSTTPSWGGRQLRTDVSITVFLSDPESYDGGELVVETLAGEETAKLAAGDAARYPSTTLHRVAEVTRGVRSRLRQPVAALGGRVTVLPMDSSHHMVEAK